MTYWENLSASDNVTYALVVEDARAYVLDDIVIGLCIASPN